MDSQKLYTHIDRPLEKRVFLFMAEEGVNSLGEFVHEMNRYEFLTIAEKYAIAYDLLRELLFEELLVLEACSEAELSQQIVTVDLTDCDYILSQPSSWYPGGHPKYSVSISEMGIKYLDAADPFTLKNLDNRLLNRALR